MCVPGRLMKCVRNSVRIVDRSGVHSRPLHTKLAHTHIHRRTRAFWKFDIFQFSLLLGQAACLPASLPACLHFMMATPITTDANSFPFIHSFIFFFILANRKLLKCHTDISYSMQIYVYILYNTYLYISVCVCVVYMSLFTPDSRLRQMKNMQMKLLLNFQHSHTHIVISFACG